jgi:hypothetical protein
MYVQKESRNKARYVFVPADFAVHNSCNGDPVKNEYLDS